MQISVGIILNNRLTNKCIWYYLFYLSYFLSPRKDISLQLRSYLYEFKNLSGFSRIQYIWDRSHRPSTINRCCLIVLKVWLPADSDVSKYGRGIPLLAIVFHLIINSFYLIFNYLSKFRIFRTLLFCSF